jgi:hypothetical protein
MMTQRGWCTQNFCRKALHGFAYSALGLCLVVIGSMIGNQAMAQSSAATPQAAAAPAKPDQSIVVEVTVLNHVEKPSAN